MLQLHSFWEFFYNTFNWNWLDTLSMWNVHGYFSKYDSILNASPYTENSHLFPSHLILHCSNLKLTHHYTKTSTWKGADPCLDYFPLTWDTNVSQDSLLSVLDTADLGEVHVQGQEASAAEERQRSHADAVVAGILVAVEDAVLLNLVWSVDVALVSNAAKNYYGEKLWGVADKDNYLWLTRWI